MTDLLDSLERMAIITNSDVLKIAVALVNEGVISLEEFSEVERIITAP